MVDTKHMPDYDVTRMKQINKHERPNRVPNFFIAFSITCDLLFAPAGGKLIFDRSSAKPIFTQKLESPGFQSEHQMN